MPYRTNALFDELTSSCPNHNTAWSPKHRERNPPNNVSGDNSLLDKAIRLAAEAHAGQTEKNGSPYILHPLRLMFRMHGELEMAAAVLHDVVEDTDWTLERLGAAGFPPALVDALDCLTHRPGEPYPRYVRRAAANPVARRVKLADLEDNLDLRRLPAVGGGPGSGPQPPLPRGLAPAAGKRRGLSGNTWPAQQTSRMNEVSTCRAFSLSPPSGMIRSA